MPHQDCNFRYRDNRNIKSCVCEIYTSFNAIHYPLSPWQKSSTATVRNVRTNNGYHLATLYASLSLSLSFCVHIISLSICKNFVPCVVKFCYFAFCNFAAHSMLVIIFLSLLSLILCKSLQLFFFYFYFFCWIFSANLNAWLSSTEPRINLSHLP